MLLTLSCAVGAGSAGASERLPSIVSADASNGAAALDLSFDPDLTAGQAQRRVLPRLPAHPEPSSEAPFSLGVDIKTRPEVGNEARQSAAEPTLTDEVEGVVKRSTFGVTGTYRF